MLASTEIPINFLKLKFTVLEIICAWGFGVNSSVSFHLQLSSKRLMAWSNCPNVYPITATAKNQLPFGQCNSNHVFSNLLCFTKSLSEVVLCINASLCGKGWKGSSYLPITFHAKKLQRSFFMAVWELNLQHTLWTVLRAGGRLKFIPACFSHKQLAAKSSLSLSQPLIKLIVEGEKTGSETQAQQAPNKYLGFLSFTC